jgi:hypothetical protein
MRCGPRSCAATQLAAVAAAFPGAGIAARAALAVVAGAGIAAAAVLPRLAGSELALRLRLGRWLSPRTTSLHRATHAWAFVFGCWLVRGVACFILLGTLGLGYSFPLALLFLCAGAAAALPIGPAGAATQAGAGTAALAAAGIGGRRRLLPLSPWAPWGSSPGQQSCSSPLPGAPDGCWCPLGPQPEDAPAQSATARPRPSASALAGGEVVRELSPESRGPGPAWCGINRVPMWDSLAFL